MKVLTGALIKKSEENAVASGIFSFKELMFRAGSAAAKIIMNKYNFINKKFCVLCGRGNNGGDGFVIADILNQHGADVTIITPFGKPLTENANYYFNKAEKLHIKEDFSPDDTDFIIDALFGIGFNRTPDMKTKELFDKVNSSNKEIISIDVPSGVETDTGKIFDTAIKASLTITFIALKPCLLLPQGSDYCGEIKVADIGVNPLEYSFLTIEKPFFPKRRHNSHKGVFGTAIMFCGSYGMAGAAILSARAALRSGVGIVKCAICDGIYQAFTCAVPEAVCIPMNQTKKGTLPADTPIPSGTAILFGCGVGVSADIKSLIEKIVTDTNVPLIIDADGINALCSSIDIIKKCKAPVILTPHPGEMSRLTGISVPEIESDRVKIARNFSTEYGCILVLKGSNTIVALPDGDIFFNTTGNPGMSVGGSGDVLSGIIVSLLAQGLPAEKATMAAVYLHGIAGDNASAKRSKHALLPSDMIEEL